MIAYSTIKDIIYDPRYVSDGNIIQCALSFNYCISFDLFINWLSSSTSAPHNHLKILGKNLFQSGCLFLHISRILQISQTPSVQTALTSPYSYRSAKDAILLPLRTTALIVKYVCNHRCFKENWILKPLETPFYGMTRLKRVFLLPQSYWLDFIVIVEPNFKFRPDFGLHC